MDKEIDVLKEKFYSIGYEDGKLVNKQRIDKAVEILYKRKHVENLLGGVEDSNTDKIINILKGDDTNE